MAYVMIVDDDADFAAAAATALRQEGHAVHIELETDQALEHMAKQHPDLVILDVMFPESSSAGFELARTLRHERDDLKQIPILMLTAVNQKFPLGFSSTDIDEDWLPVADFLEKPVDLSMLSAKVDTLLAQREPQTPPQA